MSNDKVTASEQFKSRIWLEYPVPREFSVWGGDLVHTLPLEDLDALIEMCVEDVATDIVIREHKQATGLATPMPADTVTVLYANLDFPYQGNRQVKASYDHSLKQAFLRSFPAVIVYQRKMHVEDIDRLQGDRLIYFRYYVMNKMATLELSYLKTMSMNVDNGNIDLETLKEFANKTEVKVKDLRESILIYAVSNG
jgi:hypothetical protein